MAPTNQERSEERADSAPPPTYAIPKVRFLQAAWYIAIGKPRDLGADFRYLSQHLPDRPRVEGAQYLPLHGPVVLVANHYERPGLWMAWPGMIVARVLYEHLRRRLQWVAISEWRNYSVCGVPVPSSVTRFLFGRFFKTFGFIAMAPADRSRQERALGARAAIEAIERGNAVGILPEGDIGSTPAMIEAQAGSGSLLLGLAARSALIIPVGISETDNHLHIRFGPPIDLDDVNKLPRSDRDAAARLKVMGMVADLVPSEIRGFYGSGR